MVAQGRLAAEHFSERGFRQVAFVGRDPWSDARPVYDGFHDRAAELGLSCGLLQLKSPAKDERLSPAALFKRRERQMTAWLRSLPKPVGVLTYTDRRAAIICATAKHAGLAVPEEIAILGRGNDPYTCEVSPVMLSSIDFDHTGMGWQAARLLQRLMQGEAPPEAPILIPPKGIVERQSTDVLATPDPHVAAALRYMWDHLDLDVSVDDVARAVSVPRHRLERAFRQHLDRGINEELRRKRLEVFRERLTATDKPISELAPSVGFRTMVHLQRSFRRAYGMSPRQWRAHALNLAERSAALVHRRSGGETA
jgi:LacI family transcriptional regulator